MASSMRRSVQEAIAWLIRLLLVVSGVKVIANALSALVPSKEVQPANDESASDWPSKPKSTNVSSAENVECKEPHHYQQQIKQEEHVCAQCGASNATQRCSACKAVRYCSVECQKRAWPSHKHVCSKEPSTEGASRTGGKATKQRKKKRRAGKSYGSFKERVETLEPDEADELEEMASNTPSPTIKNDGVSRGKLFLSKGEPKNALEQLNPVLSDRSETYELKGEAAFLAAYAASSLGNTEDANRYLDTTVSYADAVGNRKLREETSLARGNFHRAAGKPDEALEELNATSERLKAAIAEGDTSVRDVLAIALSGAGEMLVHRGDASAGADKLKEALNTRMKQWDDVHEDSEKYETLRGIAMCAVNHGAALLAAGRRSDAIEPYEMAMHASEEVMALEVHYRALTALVHLSEDYGDDKITERTLAFLEGLHDMLKQALGCEERTKCPGCDKPLNLNSEEAAHGDTKLLPLMCTHIMHRGCANAVLPRNGGVGKCPAEGCTNESIAEEVDPSNAFASQAFSRNMSEASIASSLSKAPAGAPTDVAAIDSVCETGVEEQSESDAHATE